MNFRVVLSAVLLSLCTFVLKADDHGRRPLMPEGRALFYTEPGFHGDCLVVEANGALEDIPRFRDEHGRKWDDRIASVRIEGPVTVVLYADPHFKGDRLELRHDIPDLGRVRRGESGLQNWDRCVSALRVDGPEMPPPQGNARPEIHFRNQRDADRAIVAAYREILGRDPDYSGFQNARVSLLDRGWDEDQLKDSLRNSREFRERDVEAIVRRCYREVLHRDPDPSGLRTYTRALREERWTENELRTALRRSDEARDATNREIVVKAYRDLLGREPDPSGLAHCMKLLRDGWSEDRLRQSLRDSDEYRQKGGRR